MEMPDWNEDGRYYVTQPKDLKRVLDGRITATKIKELEAKLSDTRNRLSRAESQTGALVSAAYTTPGSTGVVAEKKYSQLVEAYKSWVYSCIDKIAKSIAVLGFKLFVYRSKQTGKIIRDISWKIYYRAEKTDAGREYLLKNNNLVREEIMDHVFLQTIRKPNDFMTRFDLWYQTMLRLELGGSCGWLKARDGLGVPRKLYPLPLTKYAEITPKVSSEMTLEYWDYKDGNINRQFPAEDVFMMRYPHPASPFQGMSPIMAQVYPYDIDLFLMQQQVALFQHGAVPGLHLSTEQNLTKEQVKELKSLIDDQFAGALRSGETLITHSGLKAEKLGQTGREAMIGTIDKMARDKLITAFDLSPGKMGLVEDVNRANLQGLDRIFVQECLRPKCMLMEESIETFLLPEYDEGLTGDFDLPSVEDKDFELRAMESRLDRFVTVVNEERGKLGMQPKPWGDEPWMSMTYVQPGSVAIKSDDNGGNGGKAHKGLNTGFWTDARKGIYWKVFVRKSEKLEQIFLKPLRAYFKTVLDEVTKRLERDGKKIVGQYAGWSKQAVEKHLSQGGNKVNLRAININKKDEREKLTATFTPVLKLIMKEHGTDLMRYLTRTVKVNQIGEEKRIEIEFNVNDPAVLKYLGDRLRSFSQGVAGTTFDDIEAILRQGFAEGLPIASIQNVLWQKFESYDKYRAPLIARTETISSMNRADLEAIDQMNLSDSLLKHWLTAGDENVRETHQAAGKEYEDGIPVDEDFEVGGDTMEHPGGGAIAGENINCRCSMYYTQIEEEA